VLIHSPHVYPVHVQRPVKHFILTHCSGSISTYLTESSQIVWRHDAQLISASVCCCFYVSTFSTNISVIGIFCRNIRVVAVLHDGSKTEDEIGQRKAQQKCHKSWKCSEIARKPYVLQFFCSAVKFCFKLSIDSVSFKISRPRISL